MAYSRARPLFTLFTRFFVIVVIVALFCFYFNPLLLLLAYRIIHQLNSIAFYHHHYHRRRRHHLYSFICICHRIAHDESVFNAISKQNLSCNLCFACNSLSRCEIPRENYLVDE